MYRTAGSTAVSASGAASTIEPVDATVRAASSADVAAGRARAASIVPTAAASGAAGSAVWISATARAFASAATRSVAASCERRASAFCCADTTKNANISTRTPLTTNSATARAAKGDKRRVRGMRAATIRKASSIPRQVSDGCGAGGSSGGGRRGRPRGLERDHAGAGRAAAVGDARRSDVCVEARARRREHRDPDVVRGARDAHGVRIGRRPGGVAERRLERLQRLRRDLREGTAFGVKALYRLDRLLSRHLGLDIVGRADIGGLAVRCLYHRT